MPPGESLCPGCGRVFDHIDWPEPDCPFCACLLVPGRTDNSLLSGTLSLHIPWPKGEPAIIIGEAGGYLNAQVLKAALESAGIAVLLQGETTSQSMGLWLGGLGSVKILVPESQKDPARSILDLTEK